MDPVTEGIVVCAYLTESTLATIAMLLQKRGRLQYEVDRQIDIASYGLKYLRKRKADPSKFPHFPRVHYLLQADNNHISVRQWVQQLLTVLP